MINHIAHILHLTLRAAYYFT
uniref:Uncharacterized protein n=1 Tax=Rhizophora mucronata TaxID=61149 RepID=A0A2P2PGN0_RHIMU